MRTSRLSKETARIANALSSKTRRTSPSRITSSHFSNYLHQSVSTSSTAPKMAKDDFKNEREDTDSDLSEAPSTLSDEYNPMPTLKRKRGADTPTTTITTKSEETAIIETKPATAPKKKAPRRQPAKKVKLETGEEAIAPPSNWERVYNLTQEMRRNITAPVDTMGCESSANPKSSPKDQRLQTLIALMLSSQTKDPVTFAAIQALESSLPGGLSLQALLDVEPERLNELIGKVGFHNNKTKYIKQAAILLRDNFGGDIPDTIEGLISLPGVGPKMAYLCMSAAWGRDEGIGVDVHVHRITNLWGWHKTNQPEETRKILQSWLPREKWHEINHLLVGFGQMICLPVGRKCGECLLPAEGLCPGAVRGSVKKERVKREVEVEVKMNGEDGDWEADVKVKEEVKVEAEEVTVGDIEDLGMRTPRASRAKGRLRGIKVEKASP